MYLRTFGSLKTTKKLGSTNYKSANHKTSWVVCLSKCMRSYKYVIFIARSSKACAPFERKYKMRV